MAMVVAVARRRNLPREPFAGIAALWRAFLAAALSLATPVILFGGMISGLFTPTEAAAVAAGYALLLGLVIYRSLPLRALPRLLAETVETTGVVLALLMTATALAWCLSLSRIPQMAGPAIVATVGDPLLFLLAVNVVLLLVGTVMEAIAAMLVLVPILVPAASGFGIDPIHFGLVFVLNLMIGTITPPVGIVLFVTARVAGLPFDRLSRAIVPWLAPLVVVLLAVTLYPPLATWLPLLVLG